MKLPAKLIHTATMVITITDTIEDKYKETPGKPNDPISYFSDRNNNCASWDHSKVLAQTSLVTD